MHPASVDSLSASARRWLSARAHPLAALLAFAFATCFAQVAAAYCRADVDTNKKGMCRETPGVPLLHWLRSCSTYAFSDRAFGRIPLLDEAQVRTAFADSFAAWHAVDCGRQPFFVQQAQELSDQDEADFAWDVVNTSVIAVHSASEWEEQEYAPEVVALTTLFHDSETGEIFDVDIELNGGAGAFSNCSVRCAAGRIDLRNTITHEAGHYFGLGHSEDRSSTMAEYAFDGRETEKATLEADDRAGYCALELPQHACASSGCSCSPPPKYSRSRGGDGGGCAVGQPRSGALGRWVAALMLAGIIAGRRRRPRPSR
jgi:Matrixin